MRIRSNVTVGVRIGLLLGAAVALGACSANGAGSGGPITPTSLNTPLPQVTMDLSPQSVQSGDSATIKWSSTNATACTASGSWNGSQALSNQSGVSTGALTTGTYSYGLTCVGAGGSSSAVGLLTVGETTAPLVDLQLQPVSVQPGQTATLSWTTAEATSCSGIGGDSGDGWAGTRATSESTGFHVGPFSTAGTYSYTLECTGNGGSGSDTRILTVDSTAAAPPPVVTITANPTQVLPGQSSSLSWSVTNATACSASGGMGSDGWSGSKATSSTSTTIGPFSSVGSYSYTLNCSGSGGSVSQNATVVVVSQPQTTVPTVDISVDPGTITAGVSAGLSWTSENVGSCLASGSWNGARALAASGESTGVLTQPGTYSYTLTCTGTLGSVTDTAVLTVNPPPASILAFDAAPTSIVAGQSTTLSWTTLNAVSCTGSGGTGSDSWSGSKPATDSVSVGPLAAPGTFTYTLACSGPGGASAIRSATVTVTAAPVPAAVATFGATPNAIQVGESFGLSWTSTNATSCAASGGTGADAWTGTVATSNASLPIGPINIAGSYNYTLSCTGAGGASPPATVSVSVGAATPPPSILGFHASATSLQAGQSMSLDWSTANATSCTALNGAGGDGWTGAQAASSTGTVVGPITPAGTYTYGLVCSGPGGVSGTSSVNVVVNAVPPPPSITALSAVPNSIQAGQTTTLAWATLNATSCTATGGALGDGWGGSVAASSTGTVVGPISTAGTYTYTLACTGPGGAGPSSSTTVTVSSAPVGPPTLMLVANDVNPAQIQPGQSLTLKWTTTAATSCSATGGTGSDGWAGTQGTSSAGLNLGAIASPGIYTYSLTCVGTGGSVSGSVVVAVVAANAVDCGIGTPSVAMLTPSASVNTAINGVCLVGCNISNASRAIDSNLGNYATMSVGLGVLAYESLRVTDNTVSYPAGRRAGFMIADPSQLLSLSVLGNITVRTLLNGVPQEAATAGSLLELTALGLLSDPNEGFIGFRTTKLFNAVRLDVGSLASVSTTMRVYGACVTLQ